MRSFTYTERIDRAPEEIFAFMTDFANAPRWRSLVRRIDLVGTEPLRQGSEIVVTIDVMGRQRQAISEVWSYDPPRRLGFRNTEKNVTGEFEYVLAPDGPGTRVTMTCDVRPRGLLWLLLPWLLRGNRARYRDQLARLKSEIEKARP
jgi:carbon monoxide dehydrogenase subunit G